MILKKRDQTITLSTQSSVKIGGEAVQVDLQLLFQRLTESSKASRDMASVFKYELCSHPPALFDTSLLLRQPHTQLLTDATWALLTPDLPGITGQVQFVLDGHILSGLFLPNHWVEFNTFLVEASLPRGDVHIIKVIQLHVILQSYGPFVGRSEAIF